MFGTLCRGDNVAFFGTEISSNNENKIKLGRISSIYIDNHLHIFPSIYQYISVYQDTS